MKYKIRVKDEEQSREVQEILFELGYKWLSGDTKVCHTHAEFLFIDSKYKNIHFRNTESYFANNEGEEIVL